MYTSDLKKWPIFTLLDSSILSQIRMAVVFGSLGEAAIFITKDKKVYGIGSNKSGCLGIGDVESTVTPMIIKALCNKDIKTISYSRGQHILALTKNGEIYAWGENRNCQLGLCSNDTCYEPTLVEADIRGKNVIDVACGASHSVALTDNGEVYAWGSNLVGQVTNVTVGSCLNVPKKVTSGLANKNIVQISCGESLTMVLTKNGELFSWGANAVGQMGCGTYSNQSQPCQVHMLNGVTIEKVVCGYQHVLALSNEGVLYVWGGNNFGQLGLGNNQTMYSPAKLEWKEMGKVLDIASTSIHNISIALVEDNRIFMWGQCLGQCVLVPTLTPAECIDEVFARFAHPKIAYRPITIFDGEEEPNFVDCFGDAFDDQNSSDFTINVQGKPIFVHKAILKIRSEYFRTMFEKEFKEDDRNSMDHSEYSYDTYKSFLKYLYTAKIDLSHEEALNLLELATAFSENRLKHLCAQIIKRGITVENVIDLYSLAIGYSSEDLEDSCFKFAMNHMALTVQTDGFCELSEKEIKMFMTKAADFGAFKT